MEPTWALEVSRLAVETANKNVEAQLASPSARHYGKGFVRSEPRIAKATLGDFFKRNFESEFGANLRGFDVIYNYTVCI